MTQPVKHPFLHALLAGVGPALARGNLLLAVSGGGDSMALMRGMLQLGEQQPCRLAVAHFNHMLRGDESLGDAAWLEQTCGQLGIEFFQGSADIAQLSAKTGKGIEETARDARYQFLWETAVQQDFSAIAVAHTKDDQVETILHHLLRGTGIAGLRGMPALRELKSATSTDRSAVSLLRPMLRINRREVVEYLAEISQEYREDPSNRDAAYTRNRVRHELLPLLEQSFNPNVRDAIDNLGRQAAQLQDSLEFLVTRLLIACMVDIGADIARLQWDKLSDQPRHVIRECYAQLWKRQNWSRQRMNFEHFDRLAEMTLSGGTLSLPAGITAERRDGLVVLRRQATR